jgi:hypothetical protein
MLKFWNDHPLAKQMGAEARKFAFSKVNFSTHWAILKNIINDLPLVKK